MVPDQRRFAVENEAPRHYIDIDHWDKYPFKNVPRTWKAAVEKFSEDSLYAYGILPWHLEKTFWDLVQAFKEKDVKRILQLSADLGHYLADAHTPLHTTENYDGQKTNQRGIHALWESFVPEQFGETFDLFVGKAYLVKDIRKEIWQAILESHRMIEELLKAERDVSRTFPPDKKFVFYQRGQQWVKHYSRAFLEAFYHAIGKQQEQRMRQAILRVGSFWYTAWVYAGKPELEASSDISLPIPIYPKQLKIRDREAFFYDFSK